MQMVIGISTMSSDWNVKDMNAEYSSNPAKFRDLIREINNELIWAEAEQCIKK
jgi:hypothetical protein